MSEDRCMLTTKDFTILEVMLDRCPGADERMTSLLRRKLNAAAVMFRDDIPEDVVTLNSRVSYRVDGGPPDIRVVSHETAGSPVGLFLPIANPRGLALLGLSAGQTFRLPTVACTDEWILLESVLYQPEAARRARAAPSATQSRARPALRLVHEADILRKPAPAPAGGDFDDPGPSAA